MKILRKVSRKANTLGAWTYTAANYSFIKNMKMLNFPFFHYKQENSKFKKHTGRNAGAMETSCSSINQISTVKIG